jgi:hypothetical protein
MRRKKGEEETEEQGFSILGDFDSRINALVDIEAIMAAEHPTRTSSTKPLPNYHSA